MDFVLCGGVGWGGIGCCVVWCCGVLVCGWGGVWLSVVWWGKDVTCVYFILKITNV